MKTVKIHHKMEMVYKPLFDKHNNVSFANKKYEQ